ncbi:Permease of the drug/metabolite transporter (DMT) superfamily [Bacillus paralicheniformis]|nr:Permease of the drug/metabolite transporter (DMT) superfamily [Bacillus paralicheniformis]
MIFIFLLEYQNQKTLGMLPPAEKLWGAYFQAVTPRTAGFNTTDIGSLHESTITLLLLLMFVGAVALAYWILDESVMMTQVIGGAVIFSGIILFMASQSMRKNTVPSVKGKTHKAL